MLPPDLVLTLATSQDRDFIARLSEEVFSVFGPYGAFLPGLVGEPGVWTVVARSDAANLGYAMFAFETALQADLVAIATEPAWQSRGIGRRVLAEVERRVCEIRRRREAWLGLSVAVDNHKARRFFEAAGFVPVPGAGGTYPAGQVSVRMRKRLRG